MVSCCLPLFQCFELVAVLIPVPDEVFTSVVGHFVWTIEPVDVSLTVTSDQPSFVLLRHGRLFGGVLASSGITGFALLMGVAFFKAQFRVSTYCLEMAAIPLATMQIRRIGLATADAWQIGVARTDQGVASFLSLSLVLSGWPELCQPLLAAFAPVLFSLFLLLDALSRGFHLLLLAFFHCEDCAMLRAAPPDPDVVEFRHEVFTAYFALTAGWFTHGHHLEPVPA